MDPVEIDVEVPLSFRAIVGSGVTLLGLPLAIGGAHLYIAYHYSYFFQDISRGVLREGVWLHRGHSVLTLSRFKFIYKSKV
mgnify:CR=1 FL=1